MKTLTVVLSLLMLMQSQARPTAKMKFKQTRVNEQGSHQVIAARAGCVSWSKLSNYDGRANGVPALSLLDEGPAGQNFTSNNAAVYNADGPGRSVPGCIHFTSANWIIKTTGGMGGSRFTTFTAFVKLTSKHETGLILSANSSGLLQFLYNVSVDRFRLTMAGLGGLLTIDVDAPGSPVVGRWYWVEIVVDRTNGWAGVRIVPRSSLVLGQQLGRALTESITWGVIPGGYLSASPFLGLGGYATTGFTGRLAGVGVWSRRINNQESAFLAAGVDWPFYWPTVTARLSPALSGWAGGTRPDPVYLLWDDTDPTPISYQLRAFEIDGVENISSTAAFVSGNSLGALADYLDRNNDSNQAFLLVRGLNASGYPVTPWSNVVPGREYPPEVAQSGGPPGLRRPHATPAAPSGLGRAGTGPVTVSFTPTTFYRHEVWAEYVADAGYALLTTLAAGVATYEDASGNAATSYRVRAVGHGEPSDWITSAGVTIPTAPSGLAFAALSTTQADLLWTDNSADETGFDIHVATDGGSFALAATNAANDTTWIESLDFTTYQRAYQVRAANAAGNSAFTATIYTPPVAPVIVSILPQGVLSLEFTFTHPDQSAAAWVQGYTVEARNGTQASAWETVATLPPGYSAAVVVDCTTMTPAGTDGDEIEVRLRAYKGAQNSAWSNIMLTTINV